jgi:hypothetical protein
MHRPSGTGAVLSSVASLASLTAALSCCLPLGTMLMAAGAAGASLVAETLRPWLLWLSVACVVVAFVQTYVRGRCEFRYRRVRTLLLWFSVLVTGATLLAPRLTSSLLAGRLPSFTSSSRLYTFDQREFLSEFQAASAKTRLVVLLSPT